MHFRPASVPRSAVWVDNTFVDCSVDTQARANRCTVYKDDTGEILADGLFVLNTTYEGVDKSQLHYAGYGEEGIYLADLKILQLQVPSQRDPSHRVIDERLKSLASKAGIEPLDCNKAWTTGKADAAADCAVGAIADKKPFYVHFYEKEPVSFRYVGFAGVADGTVYGVFYSHGRTDRMDGMPNEENILANHMLVLPCPKPTILAKSRSGIPTCFQSAVYE
jgi:hypothetical protein